jgi:hypothetical protein
VEVRPGQGPSGGTRVEIAWASGAIVRQWLQVTVLANADTGLAAADVFYFGNLPGEVGNAPSAALSVNSLDLQGTRNAQFTAASITSPFDFDRSGGNVNSVDLQIVRNGQFTSLPLLSPPPAALRWTGKEDGGGDEDADKERR